jgi:hypothetical protein
MQMSFRDIGIIIDKVKAETERQREHTDEEEIHDIRRKSKESYFSNCISATNTIAINIKSRQRDFK